MVNEQDLKAFEGLIKAPTIKIEKKPISFFELAGYKRQHINSHDEKELTKYDKIQLEVSAKAVQLVKLLEHFKVPNILIGLIYDRYIIKH